MNKILVDSRIGSKEFIDYLPPDRAELAKLEFGDFSFIGNGEGGAVVSVGLERKTIRDLAACMIDGRLCGHQIPGMMRTYHYIYLIIEGRWGYGQDGILRIYDRGGGPYGTPLNVGQHRFMARDIDKYLNTLMVSGIMVWKTYNRLETAHLIQALYSWWNDKQFCEHNTLKTSYDNNLGILENPIPVKMLKAIPGIGEEKAWELYKKYGSIVNVLDADPDELQEIYGIGGVLAHRVIDTFNRDYRNEKR